MPLPSENVSPATNAVEASGDQASADELTRVGRAGSSFVLDPNFYLETWKDVRAEGVDPTLHYEQFGRRERRQCCEAQMQSDIAAIETSGVLAKAAARGELDDRSIRNRLIDLRFGVLPIKDFNAQFVLDYYHRTLVEGEDPFAFYCRHARRLWCFANAAEAEQDVEVITSSQLFDPDYVLGQMAPELRHLDPALYYVTEGFRARLDPSAGFSTRAYILEYPDVSISQTNPLAHFERHGRFERRLGVGRRDADIQTGRQTFRTERPTLIVCSNEAGRSGAPMVGLNLARHLCADYNVVSVFQRGGPLMDRFADLSIAVAICGDTAGAAVALIDELCARYSPMGAILNSVEAARIVATLKLRDLPVVSLIHDFAQYVAPFDVMSRTISMSDRTIFPAEIVKAAALRELADLGFDPAEVRNVDVRPQGRSMLPPVDVKRDERMLAAMAKRRDADELIIVGAGYVQPRKGVDLFVETARVLKYELGIKCRFIWVGGGYAPRKDLLTSVYIAEQVRASALTDTVLFIPELQDLSTVWQAADVFFMSSRMDPFPNVALDALAEGLPVVCFQQATGIAELAETVPDRVTAVAYNDTQAAARALASAAVGGRHEESEVLNKLLSFERYTADIVDHIEAAVAEASTVKRLAVELRRSKIDPMLLFGDLPNWPALQELSGSVGALSRVASRSALNGVSLGRLRHGRTTRLSPTEIAEVEADRVQGVWSEDNYDCEMVTSEGPLDVVLICREPEDIVTLAEFAFGQTRISRFVVICNHSAETELNSLAMVAPKNAILHLRNGMEAEQAADFLGSADCLLIAPVLAGIDWKINANRLVHERSKRDCGVAFMAAESQGPQIPSATIETNASQIWFDQRLVDPNICRLYSPTRGDLVPIIQVLAKDAWARETTMFSAVMESSSLRKRNWAMGEPIKYARLDGYDLLIGREPITIR